MIDENAPTARRRSGRELEEERGAGEVIRAKSKRGVSKRSTAKKANVTRSAKKSKKGAAK